MIFRHRVAVEDGVGRYLYHTTSDTAQALVAAGRATVQSCKGRFVELLRLAEHQRTSEIGEMGIWPGSYGVHREHASTFSHRRHYGELFEGAA